MRRVLACAAMELCACLPLTGRGTIITETEDFCGAPSFDQVLTFNQYSGAAPLLSINIALVLQGTGGSLRLDNDGANPASGVANFGINSTLASGTVILPALAIRVVNSTGEITLAANDSDPAGQFDNDDGLDNYTLIGGTVADNISAAVDVDAFAAYTGVGTFDITVTAEAFYSLGGMGGISFNYGSPESGSGHVQVTYTTAAVPEPAAGGLLLLGLAGLPGRRRRR